jgi:hypothetical protein
MLLPTNIHTCHIAIPFSFIPQVWKFEFAIQNPVDMMLSKCAEQDQVLVGGSDAQFWHAESLGFHAHTLVVPHHVYKSVRFFLDVAIENVEVIYELEYTGNNNYCTILPAIPLSVFLQLVPLKASGAGGARAPPRKRKVDAIIEDLPWTEKFLKRRQHAKAQPVDDDSDSDDSDDCGINVDDEVEFMLAQWDELTDLRKQWETDPRLRTDDFRLRVLGGKWTLGHRGVIADALCGYAVAEHIEQWCTARAVPMSYRCEISLYTIEVGAVMVRAWCTKMQYFYNLSLLAVPGLAFAQADIDAFFHPVDFLALQVGFRGNRVKLRQWQKVLNLFA